MNKLFTILTLLMASNFCTAQVYSHYNNDQPAPKNTEAAYFYTGAQGAALPLLKTHTEISIDSTIADIQVKQTYRNEGSEAIEAVYTFPGSEKAAIYALSIQIEDRLIKAEIEEKAKARSTYESAKREGKTAALLEQNKPNLFTMNVANILPGEVVEVTLKYTELLDVENNVYELVYPISTLSEQKGDINVLLKTAIPVHTIMSPSHSLDIVQSTEKSAEIKVSPENSASSNLVFRYQLSGEKIQSGLQLYSGREENYFLLQIEPPARIEESIISNREYIFVIDTSGSMHGFPMEVSRSLISELLNSLKPWEKFNVIFFSGGSNLLSPNSLDATPENIRRVTTVLKKLEGSGSTNLSSALKTAANIPSTEGYSRNIVTITDGYIQVEADIFKIVSDGDNRTNYFAFGVGDGVNRNLVNIIARAGFGESFVAFNKRDARKQGKKLINTIRYPILTQIGLDFGKFDVYDIQPFLVPDLFSNRPITISGKWRGTPEGNITISGNNGFGLWEKAIPVHDASLSQSRSLEYIWARREIQHIQDFLMLEKDTSLSNQIVDLSKRHNLLTDLTSFVAVDSLTRTGSSKDGQTHSNGFFIAPLTMSLTAAHSAAIAPLNNDIESIGAFNFYKKGQERIDINHSAEIPVVDFSFDGALYKKLLSIYPELRSATSNFVYYINFHSVTLRFSNVTRKDPPQTKDPLKSMLEELDIRVKK